MPAKAKPKPAAPLETLSFEDAFAELEDIVSRLEAGSLTLDDSVALHERGQALSARCQQLLDAADLKVQQLTPRPGGGYQLQPFAPDEG
ncbi:MAG: exodeoxyribonuclease VII small subunit [Anaerolineales bacterium]|nr:exodeoxyribonuclease VII small subunit [Anaerolineales bacterium]